MARFVGPRTVTSGLVLCLDAANKKSYPGSGSSVSDMSGNQRTMTLFNSPTYNSSNNGYIEFNGTSQYGSFSVPAMTAHSLGFWLYVVSLPASGEETIFGAPSDTSSISILFSSGTWKWHSWSGSGSRIGNTISTGQWYNFVMTTNPSPLNTSFYVNGQLDSSFGSAPGISAGTGYLFYDGISSRHLNARFGNLAFYNRVLTAAEVAQNYNALRGRYGI